MPERYTSIQPRYGEQFSTAVELRLTDLHNDRGPVYEADIRQAASETAREINETLELLPPERRLRFIITAFNADLMLARLQFTGYSIEYGRTPGKPNNGKTLRSSDEPNITSIKFSRDDEALGMNTYSCTYQEYVDWVDGIRAIYLEELTACTTSKDLQVLYKKLGANKRIWELTDGTLLKLNRFDSINNESSKHDPEYRSMRLAALEKLYSAPSEHENIAYSLLAAEVSEDSAHEVMKKMPLDTLYDYMQRENYQPREMIRYVVEFIEGIEYLASLGLRITDLHPMNIGINTETHKGMVFDFDTLVPEDYETTSYPARKSWSPPRWQDGSHAGITKKTYTESDQVFELGRSLRMLSEGIQRESDYVDVYLPLTELSARAVKTDETERITLAQLKDELTHLIPTL